MGSASARSRTVYSRQAAGFPVSRLTHCQTCALRPASVKMMRCSNARLATSLSILRRTAYWVIVVVIAPGVALVDGEPRLFRHGVERVLSLVHPDG